MRVRDHIAVSSTGAALLQPWLRHDAMGLWAGSVLLDVDHYVWFCLRHRRWSPMAAMRFFNEAQPPQHAATRVLHNPVVPLALLALGVRRRALASVALGMVAHIALDVRHDVRMDQARAAALARDAFSCQTCGACAPDVGTHLRSQPRLLPSYKAQNLVALCDTCHTAAHARAGWTGSWS
jgi:hypothetical protein